jgi:hypothetical protein
MPEQRVQQLAFKVCDCLLDTSTPGCCTSLGPCPSLGVRDVVEGQHFGVGQADSYKGAVTSSPRSPQYQQSQSHGLQSQREVLGCSVYGVSDQQCMLGTLAFPQQTGHGPAHVDILAN